MSDRDARDRLELSGCVVSCFTDRGQFWWAVTYPDKSKAFAKYGNLQNIPPWSIVDSLEYSFGS